MKKTVLIGLGLLTAVTLAGCGSSNASSSSSKASKSTASSKVEKIKPSSSTTFKNNVYESKKFKINITSTEFVQDINDKKALFVKYTYTNKTNEPQTPSFVTAEFIHVKQDAGSTLKDLGNSGSFHVEDDQSENAKLLATNGDEVKPGATVQTADMYPLETTGEITMHFANINDYKDIGILKLQVK